MRHIDSIGARFDIVELDGGRYRLYDHLHNNAYSGNSADELREWSTRETTDNGRLRSLMPVGEYLPREQLVFNADAEQEYQWGRNPELDELWKALGEQSNHRSWCGEYDEFAAAHNGPKRPERTVATTVRIGLPIPVQAPQSVYNEGREAIDRWFNDLPLPERQRLAQARLDAIGELNHSHFSNTSHAQRGRL